MNFREKTIRWWELMSDVMNLAQEIAMDAGSCTHPPSQRTTEVIWVDGTRPRTAGYQQCQLCGIAQRDQDWVRFDAKQASG
jgi:hypothetical protein